MALRAIGIDKGKPWRVDAMANAFPAGIPGIKQERTDTEWLRVWGVFVVRYAERRSVEPHKFDRSQTANGSDTHAWAPFSLIGHGAH